MTPSIDNIANFIRYHRRRLHLTQDELAVRSGVGLRFIRELEAGKQTLRLDKVNQVLQLFGYTVSPGSERILDPYDILLHHTNVAVRVTLKDRTELYGIILDPVDEGSGITDWKMVSNNKAIEYKKTNNPDLVTLLEHGQIEKIENL
ncbi:MAG TPA: helix-turn-helix transcriptional regulator [Chitinophagaceae bacterium]|jgi:y4mF family transcriptional regulator